MHVRVSMQVNKACKVMSKFSCTKRYEISRRIVYASFDSHQDPYKFTIYTDK